MSHLPIVGIVGPCCAGKSTLIRTLGALGYSARHIAQEHSYAPRMWQIIGQPDVLVFLDVSYPVAQQRRLRHAREHCDLYLHTDALTIEQARQRVIEFLQTFRAE